MGGYFTLRSRAHRSVFDPVYVRAIALEQAGVRVLILVFDLVLITDEMASRFRQHFSAANADVICIATHTHSGPGGYWEPLAARLALGPVRPGALEALVEAGIAAGEEAFGDLDDAQWGVCTGALPEVAVNRRDERHPPDDHLWVLRFARRKGDILLCGFPAHPIVVAERDFFAMSADFPGRVVSGLEEHVTFAAFVNGPVGGTGTYLPAGATTPDAALPEQAGPITAAAQDVLAAPLHDSGTLRFASCDVTLPDEPSPRAAFDDQSLGSILTWPLDRIATRLFRAAKSNAARIQAVAVGSVVLVGTPADLGLNVGRAMREVAAQHGFEHPFVASQADGYIGYVHRRDDYRQRPASGTLGMAMYENIMGIFGHDVGETLIADTGELLAGLAAQTTEA